VHDDVVQALVHDLSPQRWLNPQSPRFLEEERTEALEELAQCLRFIPPHPVDKLALPGGPSPITVLAPHD
jgi:hypothetical protein